MQAIGRLKSEYLADRMEAVHALGRDGSPKAEEERSALIGAMTNLGLPEGAYVRDPSRPRDAIYVFRTAGGRHDLRQAPWRLARRAPPGMRPKDVCRVARELRSGLLGSGLALGGVLVAAVLCAAFAPPRPPPDLSPAAYLQAAPSILWCVAALLAVATLWHLQAFLFPRSALVGDFESRNAWAALARADPAGRADSGDRRGRP